MANQRATTISIAELKGAVNQAISAAEQKHKVQFEGTGIQVIPNWKLIGRVLRETEVQLQQLEQVASDITQAANRVAGSTGVGTERVSSGVGVTGHFQPGFVWDGHLIICGMIPGPNVVLTE
jgi:hypothetical protein